VLTLTEHDCDVFTALHSDDADKPSPPPPDKCPAPSPSMHQFVTPCISATLFIFRLRRMHEMLTVLTDVCGVKCLSVRLSWGLCRWRRMQCMLHAVCMGSLGAAFAKCLWPFVYFTANISQLTKMNYIWLSSYLQLH